MKFDKETKDKIAARIQEKDALLPCTRCGNKSLALLDGFVNLPLTQEISGNVIVGGPQVPCAVVGCTNCGHLEFHALGALGLLNDQNKGG